MENDIAHAAGVEMLMLTVCTWLACKRPSIMLQASLGNWVQLIITEYQVEQESGFVKLISDGRRSCFELAGYNVGITYTLMSSGSTEQQAVKTKLL